MTSFRTRYGQTIVYDPGDNDSGVIMKYKGRTTADAGAFYAPYVPLQTVGKRNLIDAVGDLWVRLTSLGDLNAFQEWMQQNDIHCRISLDTKVIHFDSSEDVTAFLLRWSGT